MLSRIRQMNTLMAAAPHHRFRYNSSMFCEIDQGENVEPGG